MCLWSGVPTLLYDLLEKILKLKKIYYFNFFFSNVAFLVYVNITSESIIGFIYLNDF